MTAPSIVRIAGAEDRQDIWRLFLSGWKENGIFALSPPKVDWFLTRCLSPESIQVGDTGPRGVIGVIGSVGNLEGLVFLTIGTYWYSEERHLEEFILIVDPEHRKSTHAQSLVNWMKSQAEVTKLPLMTGIISNERTEAKCRLYRRMLPKAGEFFLYGPKGATLTPAWAAASS